MQKNTKTIPPLPNISIRKVGIVTRNYKFRYPNNFRDFSYSLPEVLTLLDNKGCDAAIFSLYSIIPRPGYDVLATLGQYTNLQMICLEEFRDGKLGSKTGKYVVYYKDADDWKTYSFFQVFGRVNWQRQMDTVRSFAQGVIPKRVIGNTCIMLCGEINGVKYDKVSEQIVDPCGLRAEIPEHVDIILNPAHDRMVRFEMNLKRSFLSQGRLLVSVWNSGKVDSSGKAIDGKGPAWVAYRDEVKVPVDMLENNLGVEVGIISIK